MNESITHTEKEREREMKKWEGDDQNESILRVKLNNKTTSFFIDFFF